MAEPPTRGRPNEIADAIRFDADEVHRAYDCDYANRCWRILVNCDRVFSEFRARFIGRCSPVHFFWGAPDLAVTSPEGAFYSADLREFILPYDVVRGSDSPDDTLLAFLQSTYEAAADLAKWDRRALERERDPSLR